MEHTNTQSGASAGSKKVSQGITQIDAGNLMSRTYTRGLKDGIMKYAFFKDGVQYVGTTGTTLKQALAEIDQEFGKKRPGISLKA